MVWYTLAALHCFWLAILAQQWRQPTSAARFPALSSALMLGLLLVNSATFYPLLIAYFRLYPVSTPNHFAVVMLLWQLTLCGLLVVVSSWRGRRQQPLPARLTPWWQGALALLGAVIAATVLRIDMASGSLLSAWTPLFIAASTLLAIGYWNLLLLASHRLGQPGHAA